MIALPNIPKEEQESMLASFRDMLKECEAKAALCNSPVLKHWVRQFQQQWDLVTKNGTNLTSIPKSHQENLLSSFWTMLSECEATADVGEGEPVLKHSVNQWYAQWNRIALTNLEPRWVERAKGKNVFLE